MALYELVNLRQQLVAKSDTGPVVERLLDLRNNVLSIKTAVPLSAERSAYIDRLVDYYDQTIEFVNSPDNGLAAELQLINDEIQQLTHNLFYNNYDLESDRLYNSAEFIRNHWMINVNPDVELMIRQRISLHTDWKYPALEIGCQDGLWTQHLVAADPLYIIDRHRDFLDSASSQFPEAYQRRLRQYHLVNHDMSMLPQNQMGFIFSWGYFNYVSMDTMKQYLQQAMTLLRPGGVFMFSYNDGDTPGGAGMAEKFVRSYMPRSFLVPMCQSLGFEIQAESEHGPAISWLEIRRPGTLNTIKAHQIMGEIIRRDD
jgi:SAM-dependent methyltransferase